jgi:hypothetical protein
MKFPNVRYADATLSNLFSRGFTEAQIVHRWHQPSRKPKGVYGTFSKPDQDIASQFQGC